MRINYKLHLAGLVIIPALTCIVNYYMTPRKIGISEDFAKKRLAEVLADSIPQRYRQRKILLIKTKEDAINVVEPILFGIYGREKILRQRPYGVHQFGDFWFVSGSLPRLFTFGGGFEIILDSRDARVFSVTHYK